jgi:hypothetical protein
MVVQNATQSPRFNYRLFVSRTFYSEKNRNKWRFSHFIKGNFTESSPMFEEDSDETIWFSHWQKGLFRLHLNETKDKIIKVDTYNEQKGFPSNRNNTVFKIANELVFSSERGFYKFDKKTETMHSYEKWNKLFKTPPSYMRLHESINGDVWCVSGRYVGLAKKQTNNSYKMDSLTYQILQPKIIIGFENFNFIDNNNLILNTEDGFCWIDTKRKETNANSELKYSLLT